MSYLLPDTPIYLDFEFNGTTERYLNLVSAAVEWPSGELTRHWLHKDKGAQRQFYEDLKEYMEGDSNATIVCFQAEAEARSIIACMAGEEYDNPIWKWNWLDLWCEYRHLLNHNHKLKYGRQLINGKKVFTKPPKPKWQRKEGEGGSSDPEESMAAACYKLLKVEVDTERKNRVRDIIISAPSEFSEDEKEQILEYNADDIKYLPELTKAVEEQYKKLLKPRELKLLWEEALYRAEYNVRTAYMVTEGYPYSKEETKAFANSVSTIMNDLCRDINGQLDFRPFRWDKKDQIFKWKQKATKEYIRENFPHLISKWKKTDSNDISLSLDAFTQFFDYKHNYPRGVFGAQMVRYLKLKQSINGFSATSKNKTFWDYAGKDGFVRPHFNIYRSQSGRSQPSATGYLFLKAAWMRALCVPPEGYAMGTLDWASQEFFIGALLSGDKNMIKAYLSGDPYLWFAKAAGSIPKDGTREDYEELRDAYKSTTLAKMFLMTVPSMANKISNDTGKTYTEDQAEELSDLFDDVFSDFCDWRKDQINLYETEGKLKLPDGFYMWGDNDNFRSIANCPIQGMGSCIMRKAVAFAQDAGCRVNLTLHDSLYQLMLIDLIVEKMETMAWAMDKAFRYYFPKKMQDIANCRLDGAVWSPELENSSFEIEGPHGDPVPLKIMDKYIDKRALEDYKRFEKYFDSEERELL